MHQLYKHPCYKLSNIFTITSNGPSHDLSKYTTGDWYKYSVCITNIKYIRNPYLGQMMSNTDIGYHKNVLNFFFKSCNDRVNIIYYALHGRTTSKFVYFLDSTGELLILQNFLLLSIIIKTNIEIFLSIYLFFYL